MLAVDHVAFGSNKHYKCHFNVDKLLESVIALEVVHSCK